MPQGRLGLTAGRRHAAIGFVRSPMVEMAGAQVINGVCAYGFLGIASRQLGEVEFAPLSVAWAALFLVGTGCFLPLEQQLNRLLAGRFVDGSGAGRVVRRAVRYLALMLAVVTLLQVVAGPVLVKELFSGDVGVLVGLVVGVAGFGTLHVARGMAAGLSMHRVWSWLFVIEGVARIVFAGVLVLLGNRDAGAFTIAAGMGTLLSGLLVMAVVIPGLDVGVESGLESGAGSDMVVGDDDVRIGDGIPELLVSSVMTSLLINAGPVAMALLATPAEETAAGHFLTGLVIARIPVFLFPVIMSLMLPALAAALHRGDRAGFRSNVHKVMLLTAVAAVVSTIGAALVGPLVVKLAFGAEYAVLGPADLAALAFCSVTLLGALSLGQAAVALHEERWIMLAWGAALAGLVGSIAAGSDLVFRVELGLVVSSVVAVVMVTVIVLVGIRRAWPSAVVTAAPA